MSEIVYPEYTEDNSDNDDLHYIKLVPDSWKIVQPEESLEATPLLYFYRGNEILAIVPIEEKDAKLLVKLLVKFYPVSNKWSFDRLVGFFKKHIITGSLVIILSLVVGFFLISSLFIVKN